MEDGKEVKSNPKLIKRERHEFYYKKNLLAINDPELVKRIEEAEEKVVEIDPNIVISGIKNPLCSIFLGFSTRHLYDAMKRKKKRMEYFCLIEPDLGVFKHMLWTEDISDMLTDDNIDFVVGMGTEEMMPALYQCFTKIPDNMATGRACKIKNMEEVADPFQYDETDDRPVKIHQVIETVAKQITVSMGCSDDTFTRWEMMFENREIMRDSWSIKDLFGKWADVPIVVLGGGPSLEGFINFYQEHKPSCLIIAADAVLHKLLEAGIRPHMVTRCERKLTNIFKGVTKEMTKGIYYAAYPWTAKPFFDLFDDTFYLLRSNGSCIYASYDHGCVDGGVSSANAGVELALLLGSKNIILSGIDLALGENGETHVGGTQVEFNPENSKAKWTQVIANDGSTVTTIPVWQRCANEYVQSVEKHLALGEVFNIFTTAPKAVKLHGIAYQPWDKLANVFKKDHDVTGMIGRYRRKPQKDCWGAFIARNKQTLKDFEEIKNDITVTRELVRDAFKTKDREFSKMIKKISADFEGFDMIKEYRRNAINTEKLWKNCAAQYDDNFLRKWLAHPVYRMIIMDILQLDYFHMENKCNSLANLLENTDEKFEAYCAIQKDWLIKVEHYADEMIRLLKEEGGLN